MDEKKFIIRKTEDEWKAELTPAEFDVLRRKGTERPFTGEFNDHADKGIYTCKGCGEDLFTDAQKFDSGCGWPSFDSEIEGKVTKTSDETHGMKRVEILCNKCGGHLGHLFNDGPTETGVRYCVNSISLDFKKEE
ncbi:MAG: methionine-R-sulfoxide reductase [Parvicellaceae bacterium]|jgi:methionine-R-sulfoxide reductase